MKKEWVERILRICRNDKVAFFFKQWGGIRKKVLRRNQLAQRERGSDAGTGIRAAGDFGRRIGRKRTECGLSSFAGSELKALKCGGQGGS